MIKKDMKLTEGIFKSYSSLSLDRIKFFLTVLVVISLPFSESLKTVAVLIVFALFLFQIYLKEVNIRLSAVHYGFILLFISSVISSVFAENPGKSLEGAKDVLFYTIPFFVACSINDEEKIRVILWGLYISTTLASVFGIIHSIELNKGLEIHSLGNQNYTAMFLLIVITSMLSIIAFSEKESNPQRSIIIVFAAITLVASVMTVMRSSFTGLFVFLTILLLSRIKVKTILVFIMLIVLTSLAVYLDKTMWLKLLSTKSLISRMDMWKHAIDYFIESPLVGIGLNHFNHTFPVNHPVEPNNTIYDAHSLYFQTASQMGIIGLLALSLIIIGFIGSWINLKAECGFGRAIKFSALGAFLITAIAGLFDTTLHHEQAIAFTMMTGLMLGYNKRMNNKSAPEKNT